MPNGRRLILAVFTTGIMDRYPDHSPLGPTDALASLAENILKEWHWIPEVSSPSAE